jgi:hypothetical protein
MTVEAITRLEQRNHELTNDIRDCVRDELRVRRALRASEQAYRQLEVRNDAYARLIDWQRQTIDEMQARIDALMLKIAPDEMTAEQKGEWLRNQQRARFIAKLELAGRATA